MTFRVYYRSESYIKMNQGNLVKAFMIFYISCFNKVINLLELPKISYRWENLQLILEVYQFARDAAVAEAWLIAQEPYLLSTELGQTIDDVENLIKKHEAFEKSAAAQEERFGALERLTTVRNFKFFANNCTNLVFWYF